jgi:ZIP family zinc transporter
MPLWLEAGLWGLLAGGALVLGAAIGYTVRLPKRVVAGVMAFGAGVLISALSFELVLEAYKQAGAGATALGFGAGAVIYSVANWLVARLGAKHRKRSGTQQPSEDEAAGSGTGIALGALIDGIPESMAIGLTMLSGGAVSAATVAAIFVSNIPEGLSSSAGMKQAGRTPAFVFGLWTTIAVLSGLAALAGYAVFGDFSAEAQAATTALAAGGILAMLMDTMIPEAFEGTHDHSGLIGAAGFLCAFALSVMGG